MTTQKKVYLTWDDINRGLDKIYEKAGNNFRYVSGIPRGGTVLAILYSHRFDVQYMERISPHYDDILVIDDIADSGITIKGLRKDNPNIKNNIATIHYKNTSVARPDFYAEEIGADFGWIVYPWEKKDSNPIQDYLEN